MLVDNILVNMSHYNLRSSNPRVDPNVEHYYEASPSPPSMPNIPQFSSPSLESIPSGVTPEQWIELMNKQIAVDKETRMLMNRENVEMEREVRLRALEFHQDRNRDAGNGGRSGSFPSHSSPRESKLPRFDVNEDIETYFRTFENIALTNGWPKQDWASYVVPQLEGKAREAVSYSTNLGDYDLVKRDVLERYEISAECYRSKFRSSSRKPSGSVRDWVNDLKYSFLGWLNHARVDVDNPDSVIDFMIMDQALSKLPEDLRIFLKDRRPDSSKSLAAMADEFVANRGGLVYWKRQEQGFNNKSNWRPSSGRSPQTRRREGQGPNWAGPPHQGNTQQRQPSPGGRGPRNVQFASTATPQSEIRCFNCQGFGHIARFCKNMAADSQERGTNVKSGFRCETVTRTQIQTDPANRNLEKCTIEGKLEGRSIRILRDSGCTQSAVRASLVPSRCYIPGRIVKLRGIGGDIDVPLAMVNVKCGIVSGNVIVAAIDGLHRDMLLGHDLDPTCGDIMGKEMCILTRAQAKRELDDYVEGEQELLDNGNELTSIVDEGEGKEIDSMDRAGDENGRSDIDLETSLDKEVGDVQGDDNEIRGNEGTRVEHTKLHGPCTEEVGSVGVSDPPEDIQTPPHEQPNKWLNINKHELVKFQQSDNTLIGVRDRVVPLEDVSKLRVCVYKDEGVIMRKWEPKVATDNARTSKRVDQVVVPLQCRKSILGLAHDAPMAGHMGVTKTKDRVLAHFYWPGIFKDIENYCRSCGTCQFIDKGRSPRRHPLHPMPIIDTPFKRIAIDIVGPLPRTKSGNRYMLTVCDYATRYPEAIPLSNIRAETVARALIGIFSRVGLCDELVHDQGTNFISKIMTELCNSLGISQITCTAGHQQTNGLLERFHSTLKNMIKSLSEQQMTTWDHFIQPFLFAYREVPNQATGHSPFELLYGREVRGPLSLIKNAWVVKDYTPPNVVQYMLDMRQRMVTLMQDAHENKMVSQQKTKINYDKSAKARIFDVGDKVLVFLPVGASKLESKWQGPYTVTKVLNGINCEVSMPDKRKSKRVLHVNMLKPWFDREHQHQGKLPGLPRLAD